MEKLKLAADEVFSRTSDWDFEEKEFTSTMLRVLALTNGKRGLAKIGEILDKPIDEIAAAMERLHGYKLVEPFEVQFFPADGAGCNALSC